MPEEESQEITDLDAFLPPRARKLIKIEGKTYGVLDLFDLSRNELNLLLSFERRSKSMPQDAQFEELKGFVKKLVFNITDDALDNMSLRKLGALFTFVQRTAEPEVPDPLAVAPEASVSRGSSQ